jgi:hypothetical protein
MSFIRIIGTDNTANEVFHCVHFECPCEQEFLQRYLEHINNDQSVHKTLKTNENS